MRQAISVITCLLVCLFGAAAHTSRAIEATAEFSVQASAAVQETPARITVHWPQDSTTQPRSYTIYRKAPEATSWTKIATLPGTATSYADKNVSTGTAYEYQILKSTAHYNGYGYVCAGIDVPLTENRGRLVLVVDKTHASELAPELGRLQQDLVGDGWTVSRIDVARNDSVKNVKSRIKAIYNSDPAHTRAVFLFGHVPVAYSGEICPDGHMPDHQGAWPTDGYYGDMDGAWTDVSVKNTSAAEPRNRNVPGDGKFDQSTFPAPLKLMVGRVDLANMPGRLSYDGPATFPSEVELLRNYLNKDHEFRTKEFNLPERGVVGDYFGVREGEAFAASGWRNLASFFSAEKVSCLAKEGTWLNTLSTNSYLWAYGCGPGSFTSIGGLGNSDSYHDGVTTEFYRHDPKAAFMMLFGSWLGDWDSEDNFQRAVLALPSYGLTCACSGRPHWFLHHMAMGAPIGYSTRLTQNNQPDGLYRNEQNNCAGQVHIALMGDPTLRMHVVAPAANVSAVENGNAVTLNWTASSDDVLGYNVYRSTDANGPFARINGQLVKDTTFTDAKAIANATYMVRAVKLEVSASGTYYNASEGSFVTPGQITPAVAATTASVDTSRTSTLGTSGGSQRAAAPVTPTGSSTNAVRALSPTGGTATTNNTIWFDDALPAGAVGFGDQGDWWNWVSSNPAPYSGTSVHQSSANPWFHQHYFTSATKTLTVNPGESLVCYVYLDPNNTPSELMLQWNDGSSWDHRAYWGRSFFNWGTEGTAAMRNMGAMPAAGQWVRLEVPAAQVGLEGATVSGMAFTLWGGRASFDAAGKSAIVISGTGGSDSNATNVTAWVDDALPTGASPNTQGGDTWNWVSSPVFAGQRASQSLALPGMHQHFFTGASQTLAVNAGDVLVASVYIDPANVPNQLMLQWNDGSWEHRAYWGGNQITWGTDGTASRRYMGPLPPSGQWVQLQVPASQVGLEGSTLNGMAFTLYNGRATFDLAGKLNLSSTNSDSGSSTNNSGSSTNSSGSTTNSTGNSVTNISDLVWVDDALPSGAQSVPDADGWNWVGSNPAPQSGSVSHQSALGSGFHQHYFTSATTQLQVNAGDILYAYVYVDPVNVPNEIMLQWNNGSWEHRAYWGANVLPFASDGTAALQRMGSVPSGGQWVRLEVPASKVGLEGATVSGMAFSAFNGRVTWDNAGKSSASVTNITGSGSSTNSSGGTTNIIDGGGSTNSSGGDTNIISGGSTNSSGSDTNIIGGGGSSTNSTGGSTNIVDGGTNSSGGITGTNAIPGLSAFDYATLNMPAVGTNCLHILTPTMLEVDYINTKAIDPAQVASWNLVDGSGNFAAPAAGAFNVTVNGQAVGVVGVGFKRHALYAPFMTYDLRIQNSLYLQLASPISDNQTVQVKNPNASLWPASMQFSTTSDPLRFSPAVHVNQEGYMPNYTKKAMVGYYIGSLGELPINASSGFKLVDATTGAQVYQGTLNPRGDTGWTYSPAPYQKVYEADFSSFNTPGYYRLVVPGMGGSLPFLIDPGVAMAFARAYSLGLYHQRCGTNTSMPYTRFEHGACHTAPASIPWPAANYPFTWNTINTYSAQINSDNPVQTAPRMTATSQLFPYVKQGTIDVSGGHHDAGDYSKYTANCCNLIHYLMFAADSLPGVGQMDNLGIPESGDGISDVLQEAKWEADYVAKLQDTDGGFYFLTYPVNREYEGGVTPDHGDPQVVWPKTTSVTAAAVAALAQCASSPAFKKAYPQTAAMYLQKAQLGWTFLKNAIAKYGLTGAYQKITHYSDEFADQDELAWAACQMFLATGDPDAHQKLLSWFNPTDYNTYRWGWWHMYVCYGHCIRSYAFAAQSGRLSASQLDPTFLAKCQQEVAAAGDFMANASQQSAYGTSFPSQTKAVRAAGWYFSTDNAFDIAVAYALNPKQSYMDAMLANMNYEGGCNPVNVTYVTGLGWKRQREIVSQWAPLDREVLPPSGIPSGNVRASFFYLSTYGTEVNELMFPGDNPTSPYPFYDRWEDGWNVSAEFTVQNSARSLGTLSMLAAQNASLKTQPWKAVAGTIHVPTGTVPLNQPVTVTLSAPGVDLSGARITWEARDQEPAFGSSFTFSPKNSGDQWVEAEAQMPDGRRIFAKADFNANSPNVAWVDDAVPPGATLGNDSESWNWISSNPTPNSGSLAHQSALMSGMHQHYFLNATATLAISAGDVLYAWIYIDPNNLPSEVMLQWNDGSSWDHRAYWGANLIAYGVNGTVSQQSMGSLPAAGQWVQLKVPASAVGLEGKTVSGMAFTLYNGRATWDSAGRISSQATVAAVSVAPVTASMSRVDQQPGVFNFTRAGDTSAPLTINYSLGGTAASGVDYQPASTGGTATAVTFPAGAASASLTLLPMGATNIVGQKDVVLTLASNVGYSLGTQTTAQIALLGNTIKPSSFALGAGGPAMAWNSVSGKVYRVFYKDKLDGPTWTSLGDVSATGSSSRWTDSTAGNKPQRFYLLAQIF